ncbi:hypothetical protein Tco_1406042 [Tanacetum coccineum]
MQGASCTQRKVTIVPFVYSIPLVSQLGGSICSDSFLPYYSLLARHIENLVGDEAVHKELGDRMEMAATTASSLEVEQDSELDFLNTCHIKYALIENPTIYVSLIEQFWQTASASTLENGDMEITTTIDGKVKVVSEASIRRHLKLEDSDGISTFPTTEIFKQLALMGFKKTAWEHFSSNIATAIICLATNRTFKFSKLIFDGMVKNLEMTLVGEQMSPWKGNLPRLPIKSNIVRLATTSIVALEVQGNLIDGKSISRGKCPYGSTMLSTRTWKFSVIGSKTASTCNLRSYEGFGTCTPSNDFTRLLLLVLGFTPGLVASLVALKLK